MLAKALDTRTQLFSQFEVKVMKALNSVFPFAELVGKNEHWRYEASFLSIGIAVLDGRARTEGYR